MTNQFPNRPVINAFLPLIPLTSVSTQNEDDIVGTALDLSAYPNNHPLMAIVEVGETTNLDHAFLQIEESYDNITYTPLAHFEPLAEATHQYIEFTRTKRYIRTRLVIEFEQPDPEIPVSTLLPIVAILVM